MSAVSSPYPVSKERLINIPRIRSVCRKVISYLNKNRIFRDISLEYSIENHSKKEFNTRDGVGIGCTITINVKGYELDKNNLFGLIKFVLRDELVEYPVPHYVRSRNEYREIRTIVAEIPSVHSNIFGQALGFFFVRLALVIAILSGATVATLDNDTSNPERAVMPVTGIYGLFQPNMRTFSNNKHNISLHSKKNLNVKPERVRYLELSDIGIIEQSIIRRVNDTIKKSQNIKSIWIGYADDNLRKFFRSDVVDPTTYSNISNNNNNNTMSSEKRYGGRRITRRLSHNRRKSSTTRR